MLYFVGMSAFLDFQGKPIPPGPKAVTIGNFDGMHLGHQALVRQVVALAKKENISGVMLTFDPHPMKVLFPEKGTKNIFDLDDRVTVAKKLGLNFVIVEPFSRTLSDLEPETFFDQILSAKLDAKYLFVGHDFSFAKNRSGTLEVLKKLCAKNNVGLTVVPPVELNGEIISSTKIRDAVAQGNPRLAAAYLGRPYYLKGVVERGAGRGKTIGFPTANLFTSAELMPRSGVYATVIEIKGKTFNSLTNVGQNPTFKENKRRAIQVESHILNFDGDIYGDSCKVNFLEYLRPEQKFESVDKLIAAIAGDVKKAEAYFGEK